MHQGDKSILTGLLLIAALLSGCVAPVLVDYDHKAALKFVNYKCFVIDTSDELENSGDIVFSPIANRRFTRELEVALKKRGYDNNCSSPDFHVRFHTAKKNITHLDFNYRYNASPFYYGQFQPAVGFFPPPYIHQYQEGTFLIDIIDAQSKELVWRSSYMERLGRQPHKDKEIRSIIERMLDQFPPKRQIPPD